MKKVITLISILLFVTIGIFAQTKPEQINVGSSPNDKTGDPIRTAFQKHNRNVLAAWDSIHNLRIAIIALINGGATGLQAQIDVIDDSITSYNTRIKHNLDSLIAHNARINENVDSVNSFYNLLYKPYFMIQIIASDTLLKTPDQTEYIFGIPPYLNGCNLINVHAMWGNSQGNRVPSIVVYRNRATAEQNMITTGATFTTDATINATYDDVATGDRLQIRWTVGSGTTMPYGLLVYLTFKKP